jgi:Fe-S oxidoreductase
LPNSQRLDWAKGLEVLDASAEDGRDVLLWVGCAGAFDPRAQKSVQATVKLMQAAGLKVAVLGTKERCTGDSARRMGDEFLFQQLAETNIANLNAVSAKHIVTTCPHCMHTLNNEYPALGGNYQVEHHTHFLAKLADEGKLKLNQNAIGSVTYHDPCFLARVNDQTEAPRSVIAKSTGSAPIDPTRSRDKTFCCGAGGGRMWMEDNPDQRPGKLRAIELLETGAKRVAVGCPFCKVMVGDSVAQVGGENAPQVLDVAELLLEATGLADKVPGDNPAA